MPQKDMRLIAQPSASEGVLEPASGAYAMSGTGDTSYRCGGCKSKLIANVSHDEVCGALTAVRCPRCGRYNELPPEDMHHHHHHH
jgi:DNA-directed RNA polymerase subunit RPC12/RpoP